MFLLIGQKPAFSPRRGRLVAPIHVKFGTAERPEHVIEPLDRFLKKLGPSMCPSIVHMFLKFDTIRFTSYRVIAEKSRVGYLPRIFLCTR